MCLYIFAFHNLNQVTKNESDSSNESEGGHGKDDNIN